MERIDLIADKRKLIDHLENSQPKPGAVLDPQVYCDTDRYGRELVLLAQSAKAIGPCKQLDREYISSGEKIFYNVCLHRGAQLSQMKDGGLVCNYHGWEYSEQGQLQKITGTKACPKRKLKTAPVQKVGPMNFINLDKDSLVSELQNLTDGSQFSHSLDYVVNCNWKFLVESLLETYHFQFAHHKHFAGFENSMKSLPIAGHRNSKILIAMDSFSQFSSTNSLEGINIMYFLYPATFVLVMPSCFVYFQIKPKSIDRSLFKLYGFSYRGESRQSIEKTMEFLSVIVHEDFEFLQSQQRNLAHVEKMTFTGQEFLIGEFHRNLEIDTEQFLNSSKS